MFEWSLIQYFRTQREKAKEKAKRERVLWEADEAELRKVVVGGFGPPIALEQAFTTTLHSKEEVATKEALAKLAGQVHEFLAAEERRVGVIAARHMSCTLGAIVRLDHVSDAFVPNGDGGIMARTISYHFVFEGYE